MPELWWDEDGACVDNPDPDAWYEIEDAADVGRVPDPVRIAFAIDTCGRCPIRDECARRARPSDVGIWGGRTADERRRDRKAKVVTAA